MASKLRHGSLPSAKKLCRHFEGGALARCARAGLEALESEHKSVVTGGATIGCGVQLDRCRQPHEPNAHRWDYLFTLRDEAPERGNAVAIEVHHADADQVSIMIKKKEWATSLLAEHCPTVRVEHWIWIASPKSNEIFFARNHPAARRLAEAGIGFPIRALSLP